MSRYSRNIAVYVQSVFNMISTSRLKMSYYSRYMAVYAQFLYNMITVSRLKMSRYSRNIAVYVQFLFNMMSVSRLKMSRHLLLYSIHGLPLDKPIGHTEINYKIKTNVTKKMLT